MGLAETFRAAWRAMATGETDPYQPLRQSGADVTTGAWWGNTTYDTSRVDYAKARALYRNTLPDYKLGAHFARPIINFAAGYMGVPSFQHRGGDNGKGVPPADEALDKLFERWTPILLLANRNMLRDGDVFLRLGLREGRFGSRARTLDIRMLVPEWCHPARNPITGDWDAFAIHHPVYPPAPGKGAPLKADYTVIETITPEVITTKVDGNASPEVKQRYTTEQPNPWGFIPIVHFRNEPEETQLFGASDLEPLEPLFRAYHDTMLVGIQGIQLFAKPKVKFKLRNADEFLRRNFTADEIRNKRVNFRGKEVFLFTEQEDADYITAEAGTGGVQTLLELIFYGIVQTSQTPEFVLGTAVASSRASVDTQLGPFVKTIERKRLMAEQSYTELASMGLAMAARSTDYQGLAADLDTYETEAHWPEITPKDEQTTAQTLLTLFQAFQTGTAGGLISVQAAVEFLADWIPTMLPWTESGAESGERRRIVEGLAWLERVQAGGLPLAADQQAGTPNGAPALDPQTTERIRALMASQGQNGVGG